LGNGEAQKGRVSDQTIVVLVNDEPITGYEISQRQQLMSMGNPNINQKAQANFKAIIQSPSTTEALKKLLNQSGFTYLARSRNNLNQSLGIKKSLRQLIKNRPFVIHNSKIIKEFRFYSMKCVNLLNELSGWNFVVGTSLLERCALWELRCWNAARYWNFVIGTLRVIGTALLENLRFYWNASRYWNCVVDLNKCEGNYPP
ncbi:MAG: hypothetical protein ACKO8Q_00820, partial [Bacteroidota bacterium]